MKTSTGLPYRRSVRLPKVDYAAAGRWMITICTFRRQHIFGKITNGVIELNLLGKIAALQWEASRLLRPEIELDEWTVMPNHLHGIVFIPDSNLETRPASGVTVRPARSLGSFVAGYKAAVTSAIRAEMHDTRFKVWQDSFHEHGIRSMHALDRLRIYVRENPIRWLEDPENI
ncbi:MAG TPA: transposase [Thermoanaerobaculia bacterium]|nr:transposase [Thermoanaerobaculia bacterium]